MYILTLRILCWFCSYCTFAIQCSFCTFLQTKYLGVYCICSYSTFFLIRKRSTGSCTVSVYSLHWISALVHTLGTFESYKTVSKRLCLLKQSIGNIFAFSLMFTHDRSLCLNAVIKSS